VIGPRSFLAYRDWRYLKWTALGLALAVALYAWHEPVGGPSGGSWLGYAYGGIAAGLILWLMWFGVRKRSYHSAGAPLQGWLSAHVYLGLALLLLVPLHSGFQFGWNVHTLAYALMALVIASGMVGVYFYATIPALMTRNRPGQKLEAFFQQIADVDAELKGLAAGLPDHFARAVASSIEGTRIGGNAAQQLAGDDPDCPTGKALKAIRSASHELEATDERARVRRLLELLALKQTHLRRLRRDLRFKALLDLWLLFHVPLSFATLAAVAVHVFVVFYYW
jgi:hypothetical protein